MKITGFEKIVFLTRFTIIKQINRHNICSFQGVVPNKESISLMKKIEADIEVIWQDEISGKECKIFQGFVSEVKLIENFRETLVEVTAFSTSAKEDEDTYTRIWQDPEKKYGDIIAKQPLNMSSFEIKLSEKLEKESCAKIILQNQETNFEFLRRMAKYKGFSLWTEAKKIYITDSLFQKVTTLNCNEIIRYESKVKHGIRSLKITLTRYLPFGSIVQIEDERCEYVIEGIKVEKRREVYEFSYSLSERKKNSSFQEKLQHFEKTVIFSGKVVNTEDPENMGRIQVDLGGEHREDLSKNKMWIPYRTPYTGKAGGIVFIPDKGDAVEVFITNEECYACAALRKLTIPEECKNVQEKYIGNNYERRIFWRENNLEIASGKYKIIMDNEKIELSSGKSKITMEEDNITLSQGESKIFIGADVIRFTANGKEMKLK